MNSEYSPKFAERYVQTLTTPYTRTKNQALAEGIVGQVPDGATVIDVGGNVNATVRNASLRSILEEKMPMRYLVADIQEAYFHIPEEHSADYYPSPIPGIVSDAHALPFAEGSADAVILSDALEHLSDPNQALAEAHRVLKPEGMLHLVFPTMYNLDQFSHLAKPKKKRTSHVQFYSPHELNSLLSKEGFKVAHSQGVDYLGGLLFLLFTDHRFIPARNPKTGRISRKEAQGFLDLKRDLIGGRSSGRAINCFEIDSRMNLPENSDLIDRYLLSGEHPLHLIPTLAKLDPAYEVDDCIRKQVQGIESFIENVSSVFDPQALSNLLQSVPPAHRANSIYLQLRKSD